MAIRPVGKCQVSILVNGEWRTVGSVVIENDRDGTVVGGSLDGAKLPCGTRDGQTLRWDESRQRWVG